MKNNEEVEQSLDVAITKKKRSKQNPIKGLATPPSQENQLTYEFSEGLANQILAN